MSCRGLCKIESELWAGEFPCQRCFVPARHQIWKELVVVAFSQLEMVTQIVSPSRKGRCRASPTAGRFPPSMEVLCSHHDPNKHQWKFQDCHLCEYQVRYPRLWHRHLAQGASSRIAMPGLHARIITPAASGATHHGTEEGAHRNLHENFDIGQSF